MLLRQRLLSVVVVCVTVSQERLRELVRAALVPRSSDGQTQHPYGDPGTPNARICALYEAQIHSMRSRRCGCSGLSAVKGAIR